MKFHKLMSRTVMATALLGATIGIGFSGADAFAANSQTYINNGYNGSFPQSDDSQNPKTPDNQITNSNSGVTNGKDTMEIKDNSLTLDSVPSLNFNGQTNESVNNLSLSNSNDNSGLLEVTDHRNIDNKNNSAHNNVNNTWSLLANMGPVKPVNNTHSDTGINNNVWKMTLNNSSADNSTTSNMSSSNTLYNDGSSSNGNYDGTNTIMSNNGQNSGYGVNKINYDNSSAANLIIPNVAPGSYEGSVNWQLTTSVDENNNTSSHG